MYLKIISDPSNLYLIFFLVCIAISLAFYGYGYLWFMNYKLLLNISEEATVLAGPEWEIKTANDRFFVLMGLDGAHIHQASLKDLLQTRYGINVELLINDQIVYSPLGKDNVFHRLGCKPIDIPFRKARYFAVRIFDVSERHRLERELRQHQKVMETANNISLSSGRKEDVEARLKAYRREVFYKLSEEMAPSISGIMAVLPLLEEGPRKEGEERYVRALYEHGENLRNLSQNIRELANLDWGEVEIEQQPLDLHTCIEDTLDLFAAPAAEVDIDLNYWIERNVPRYIQGDKERLRRVLVNLLDNAIKHTQEGGVFVKVSLEQQPKGIAINIKAPLTIAISVKDTGSGIPKEDIPHLFDPVRALGNDTQKITSRSELGLPICKRLATLMGGYMKVESQYGKGAVFTFTIQTKKVQKPKEKQLDLKPLTGKKILVVDDQLTNRMILKYQLEGWKISPVLAGSAEEGIKALEAHEDIVLVISDMQMPSVNGVEFAKQVKGLRNIPMLLLSSIGYVDFSQTEKTLFTKTLLKPTKMKDLLHSIIDALGLSEACDPILAKGNGSTLPKLADHFPLQILVAEDNWLNQRLVSHMLDRLGYEVHMVKNGKEVLEACQQMKFDLILMDIRMPIMNGLDASKALTSELDKNSPPFIVAMTANALKGDREICLNAGMHDYMTKPFRIEELHDMIEKFGKRIAALRKPH